LFSEQCLVYRLSGEGDFGLLRFGWTH
jgi:hypothetical protein